MCKQVMKDVGGRSRLWEPKILYILDSLKSPSRRMSSCHRQRDADPTPHAGGCQDLLPCMSSVTFRRQLSFGIGAVKMGIRSPLRHWYIAKRFTIRFSQQCVDFIWDHRALYWGEGGSHIPVWNHDAADEVRKVIVLFFFILPSLPPLITVS